MLPILVVSMQTDTDRRRCISDKFNNYNIDYIFIDAVVGKLLNTNELSKIDVSKAIVRKNRDVSLGEIGCTLSHLKAYEYMVKNSLKYCLILEDDALFDERLASFLYLFDSNTLSTHDDDVIILGGQNGIDKSKNISKSFFKKITIGGVKFSKAINSEKYIFRTCCYVISLNIAKKLLSLSQKEFFIADEWAYFHSKGIFKDIYISDIIDHPLDLSSSHIESERVLSFNSYLDKKEDSGIRYWLNRFAFTRKFKFLILKVRTFLRRFMI